MKIILDRQDMLVFAHYSTQEPCLTRVCNEAVIFFLQEDLVRIRTMLLNSPQSQREWALELTDPDEARNVKPSKLHSILVRQVRHEGAYGPHK